MAVNLDGPGEFAPTPLSGRHPLKMADLETFEQTGTGHSLARHVHDGKGDFASDAERLAANPGIPASGGFLSRQAAQESVDAAVAASAGRIMSWRRHADRYTPFITELDLGAVNGHNLSRELYDRGERTSRPTTGIRIVLMPDAQFASGFAVLTAYNVSVPAPAAQVYGIEPLETYEAAGLSRALARHEAPIAVQLATGGRAARFAGRSAAQRSVARGVAYWSSEIATWLADPAAPDTLSRAFCDDTQVGETLTAAEADAGEGRMTATPVVMFTLKKDARFSSGFGVADAFPSRSF